jgi:hypothetical protein
MPSRERREFGADLMEYLLGRHAGRQPSPSCPSGECHLPPRTGNPCLPAPRGEEGWREQRAAARSVCVGVNSSSVRSINQSTSTSKEKRPNEVGWGKKKKKKKENKEVRCRCCCSGGEPTVPVLESGAPSMLGQGIFDTAASTTTDESSFLFYLFHLSIQASAIESFVSCTKLVFHCLFYHFTTTSSAQTRLPETKLWV